jgi:uncharacterized protein YozE (UPF0346 family)
MDLRVEALRKELHVHGALEREPDLKSVVQVLKQSLVDESLVTLWRLGGGLKSDTSTLVTELSSDDVCYEHHVSAIYDKLEVVCCGFGLKEILQKRGRAAQLDKVRSLIGKMRTVSRADAKGVLLSIMPELEEILEVEVVPAVFKRVVSECLMEMKTDLERIGSTDSSLGSSVPGTAMGSTGLLSASRGGATVSFEATKPGSGVVPSTTSRGTSRSKTAGMTKKVEDASRTVDPLLLKQWNRRLGIIYFASDLPSDTQKSFESGLSCMTVQRRCNKLVDDVISKYCDAVVQKFDRNYKTLIDKIATFLENQASFLNNNAAQVCDFFQSLAHQQEVHRKLQRQLIDKSADELWDTSEDFRIEREDREIELEGACQKIRESIENDELQGHFETVLSVLAHMESSYRTYHANACFKADKFPLTLIHEFDDHINFICKSLDMKADESHEILTTYDAIYDETVRLNKTFFEKDPNAAGVGARVAVAALTGRSRPASATSQQPHSSLVTPNQSNPVGKASARVQSASGQAVKSTSEDAVEAEAVDDDGGDGGNDDGFGSFGSGMTYLSPNMAVDFSAASPAKGSDGGLLGGRAADALTGSFSVITKTSDFVLRFYAEKVDPEEAEAAARAAAEDAARREAEAHALAEAEATKAAEEAKHGKKGGAKATAPAPAPAPAKGKGKPTEEPTPEHVETGPHRHPDYRYLNAEVDVVPLHANEMVDMDDEAIKAYKVKLVQAFIELTDTEIAELRHNQDSWEVYQLVKAIVVGEAGLQKLLSNVEYCRKNPPVNSFTNECVPWVQYLELAPIDLEKLVCGIRDSLIQALEREACRTINLSTALTTQRKDGFTEELEDRLRTHWPRRGRVETQVKQPREAEILGHKEKTWRHIQNIASRMAELQRRYHAEKGHAEEKCKEYVAELDHLRESLSGDFKNLASLQAIDMRARGTTIKFQADCTVVLASLYKICREDIGGVIVFAKDFRKVCPPQVAGVQGGYSEAELTEIEQLVFQQCDEINDVTNDWIGLADTLGKQQTSSLGAQEEFTKVYERVAQNLAMSEGLGQTYGAPRRRAQEKIRTEVSRDEQSAGKVDELLAKIEFYVSEAIMAEETKKQPADEMIVDDENALDGVTATRSPKDGDNGRDVAEEVNRAWELMLRVRAALLDRSTFLKVIATSPGCPELVSTGLLFDNNHLTLPRN